MNEWDGGLRDTVEVKLDNEWMSGRWWTIWGVVLGHNDIVIWCLIFNLNCVIIFDTQARSLLQPSRSRLGK